MFRLGLLFIAVTSIELALLLQVARIIKWGPTILLILFTGFLGAYLTRQQGFKVLRDISVALQRGQMPAREILHGVCILLAGAFLVTPGLLTDVFGFALLIPAFRSAMLSTFQTRIERWIKNNTVVVQGGGFGQPYGDIYDVEDDQRPRSQPNDDNVYDAEIISSKNIKEPK